MRYEPALMEAVVRAQGLGQRFGRRWALAHIDLEVHQQDRVLIIGPNGSGKTTLLHLLSTLTTPNQGTLSLFGGAPNPRERLAMMGHSPGVYEDLSASDNLRVLATLTGRPVPDIEATLAMVGLENRSDPVRALSAGMRRRLALAWLLVQQPDLALLDEPFAQMDPGGIAQVSGAINALPGAVVIASHQVRDAAPLCTRAVLLDQGQIRWTGPSDRAEDAWLALHRERGDL